ncbi:hypothetical protein D3C73_1153050 [compost metagenome]
MSACRKSQDSQSVRIYPILFSTVTDRAERTLSIPQRMGVSIRRYAVSQHKSRDSQCIQPFSHRSSFVVCTHAIPAARTDKHSGVLVTFHQIRRNRRAILIACSQCARRPFRP